ncbi:MAG: glycerol-3-phosphate 1-O-acyltransferase PlsY [Clostridiales Family XIII bacterium]|jgi:glycerol-3-phosphate acyltransferase PlsY|nr:glycerol-3-phosphate 1-O-acyltransferase PlsY [Clostridiales Family XIII bacterium]
MTYFESLATTPGAPILLVLIVIASYFVGNINPAIILGKIYGVDVRHEGSGNAGTTNVLRTVGKKAGAITFLVDVLKGFAVAFLTMHFLSPAFGAICGVAVVAGHMWPAVFGFRGGKGVATTFGVLLATSWILAVTAILIVFVLVAFFRMVSLGVIVSGILAIPFSAVFERWYPVWVFAMIALIFIKHIGNIKRILKGSESKLSFGNKDKSVKL